MDRQPTPAMEANFAKIVGRAATTAEVAQLYRIRDALQLSENDPFWLVLYALEWYRSLYEVIPMRIERAATAARSGDLQALIERIDALEETIERMGSRLQGEPDCSPRGVPDAAIQAILEDHRLQLRTDLETATSQLRSSVLDELKASIRRIEARGQQAPLAAANCAPQPWAKWPWPALVIPSLVAGVTAGLVTWLLG